MRAKFMPRMTAQEYADYERRQRSPVIVGSGEPVKLESNLFDYVDRFCASKWPNWVQIYARTDKKSTLPVGCHDRTIFGPFPKVLLIEGKKAGEKPNADQLIWHKRLEMLGWIVHVIRSEVEFLELTKDL